MKTNFSEVKQIIFEIFLFVLFLIQGLNYTNKTISGDGVGYYEYLPSIFIHNDFVKKNSSDEEIADFIERTKNFGVYNKIDDKWVNKYPCGTALLESPFFFIAKILTPTENSYEDGYQKPFHQAIYLAAVFYVLLSIVFLRKLLSLYGFKLFTICFSQILMILSTSIVQYATLNASFSHIFSLFAITAFMYFIKLFFSQLNNRAFLIACILLGTIIIIRQINGFIILFVPFLAGSWENFSNGVLFLFKKWHFLFVGIILCFLVISIQLFAWYFQTGYFIVYSYQGEGFNWLEPRIIDILFSYRKGLFIYAPITFIGLFGLIYFVKEKKYFELFSWIFFFGTLSYLLSSWHMVLWKKLRIKGLH